MVYGVLNSIRSLISKFSATKLFLTWDRGYVMKKALYPGYKKKAEVMTVEQREQFTIQFDHLYNFLSCLGVKCCFQDGVEADDIIAFLANKRCIQQQETEDFITIVPPIIIVSADHDLYPLLKDDEVVMYKLHRSSIYTASDFRKEFSELEPIQFTEVQALMGCSGDKVPGVRGIGPKFAVDLIKRYGSVRAIKDTVEEDRLVELVQDRWEDVELSMKLVAFENVEPVLLCQPPNLGKIRKLLYAWELNEFIEDWSFIENLSQL